jgi:hypothetical protein
MSIEKSLSDLKLQKEYTYSGYVKQEKWDKVKKDLKSFADLFQLFEVK